MSGETVYHPRLKAVFVLVGVSDPRVLDAVGSVPRAAFVPPELAEQANLDRPLPILWVPNIRFRLEHS